MHGLVNSRQKTPGSETKALITAHRGPVLPVRPGPRDPQVPRAMQTSLAAFMSSGLSEGTGALSGGDSVFLESGKQAICGQAGGHATSQAAGGGRAEAQCSGPRLLGIPLRACSNTLLSPRPTVENPRKLTGIRVTSAFYHTLLPGTASL